MSIETDKRFEEATIVKVDASHDGGWSITRDDGWGFFVPAGDVVPAVGSVARFYGDGLYRGRVASVFVIGSVVRGLTIDGRVVFYRTEKEQAAKHRQECADAEAKRQREADDQLADREAKRAALPPAFRARVEGFISRRPKFRRDHEPYELFVCEEAAKIAAALTTPDAVKEFRAASYEEQRATLPTLGAGHSGNTFGMACRLAWLYLTDPSLVEKEHGALCALVGCDEYGCYSTTVEAVYP